MHLSFLLFFKKNKYLSLRVPYIAICVVRLQVIDNVLIVVQEIHNGHLLHMVPYIALNAVVNIDTMG